MTSLENPILHWLLRCLSRLRPLTASRLGGILTERTTLKAPGASAPPGGGKAKDSLRPMAPAQGETIRAQAAVVCNLVCSESSTGKTGAGSHSQHVHPYLSTVCKILVLLREVTTSFTSFLSLPFSFSASLCVYEVRFPLTHVQGWSASPEK